MTVFTQADLEKLSRPHVQRAWFVEAMLPSGTRHYHSGMGRVSLGGQIWEGVSDPVGGAMVVIDGMQEPAFGQAVAIDVVFSGASRTFLKSIWDDRQAIEGATANVSFAVIDAETGDVLIGLTRMLDGKLTAPVLRFQGAAIRTVAVKIVSVFEGLNYPVTNGMWSPAGQRARYPGDTGLDTINADIVEDFIP